MPVGYMTTPVPATSVSTLFSLPRALWLGLRMRLLLLRRVSPSRKVVRPLESSGCIGDGGRIGRVASCIILVSMLIRKLLIVMIWGEMAHTQIYPPEPQATQTALSSQ